MMYRFKAKEIIDEYQGWSGEFQEQVSFDSYLEIPEDRNPEKKDLYNYIRKLKRVKVESEIAPKAIKKKEENKDEGLILRDLQLTGEPRKSKNQQGREQHCDTHQSVKTLSHTCGGPNENEVELTSSLQSYKDKDEGESHIEATKTEEYSEAKHSPHDGGLTESQVDLHASSTPLAWFYEACDTHTYDGQVDGRYDANFGSTNTEDSTSYLSRDAYDEACVLAPKYDEDLALDELPFEVDFTLQGDI